MSREIITLSNGKKVANFSSPHPFTFTDGSVIPAVSNEESERLKVNFIETDHQDESGDISLRFELSTDVMFEMRYWVAMYNVGYVDVVFCPLPMITAIKKVEDDSITNSVNFIRIITVIVHILMVQKNHL